LTAYLSFAAQTLIPPSKHSSHSLTDVFQIDNN